MKKRQSHWVQLPATYLHEATGEYQGYHDLRDDHFVAGDRALGELLDVSHDRIHRWKKQGVITPLNPRPRVYIYNLKLTLAQLHEAGYTFENEKFKQ